MAKVDTGTKRNESAAVRMADAGVERGTYDPQIKGDIILKKFSPQLLCNFFFHRSLMRSFDKYALFVSFYSEACNTVLLLCLYAEIVFPKYEWKMARFNKVFHIFALLIYRFKSCITNLWKTSDYQKRH